MSENNTGTFCDVCWCRIYPSVPHVCMGKFFAPIQKAYNTFLTEEQADKRTRAALRVLIDERDSLLDDLDAALDEIDELREDLYLAEGDLKCMLEREEAREELEKSLPLVKEYFENQTLRDALAKQGLEIIEPKPEFVGDANLFEYKIINRFSLGGYNYVVTFNGQIYLVVDFGEVDSVQYQLVAQL